MRGLSILGHQVLVANVDGSFYAVDGICPNDGGSLANGSLIGHVLKCPLDGSSFDLRTGDLVKEPWSGTEKRFGLRSYQTSYEAGCVTVDV